MKRERRQTNEIDSYATADKRVRCELQHTVIDFIDASTYWL
jgi:hypothetical protein